MLRVCEQKRCFHGVSSLLPSVVIAAVVGVATGCPDFPDDLVEQDARGMDSVTGDSTVSDAGTIRDLASSDAIVSDGSRPGDAQRDAIIDLSGVSDGDVGTDDACSTADDDNDGVSGCEGDCDDSDNRAFPGQSAFYSTPRNAGGYDFNCDDKEAPEFAELVSCTEAIEPPDAGSLDAGSVDGGTSVCVGDGWSDKTDIPPCGVAGDWKRCELGGKKCKEVGAGSIAQACR